MSLPWTAQQIEWLQAMGVAVLRHVEDADDGASGSHGVDGRDGAATNAASVRSFASRQANGARAQAVASSSHDSAIPTALRRVARGVDLAPLIARLGIPRDPAARRVFWRALREVRRGARLA